MSRIMTILRPLYEFKGSEIHKVISKYYIKKGFKTRNTTLQTKFQLIDNNYVALEKLEPSNTVLSTALISPLI